MAGIEQMDFGLWIVALEGCRGRRQKERIVLAPHRKKRRLLCTEVVLEFRVSRWLARQFLGLYGQDELLHHGRRGRCERRRGDLVLRSPTQRHPAGLSLPGARSLVCFVVIGGAFWRQQIEESSQRRSPGINVSWACPTDVREGAQSPRRQAWEGERFVARWRNRAARVR